MEGPVELHRITTSPEKISIVKCLFDPCEVTFCPKYLHAKCKTNYCGCTAVFYDRNGNVIKDCEGTQCNVSKLSYIGFFNSNHAIIL